MEKRNVPKLRFKEFSDEWKENKIGDIFRVFAGGDINKKNFSDIKNDEFKYPVYSNTLINEGIQGYSNIYRFNSETITVTGRGVNVGVAKARFCKYYPIVRLLSLIPTQEVNVKFFEEVINNTNIFIESTGVPQLTSPQIAKVKVSSPSLEEQIKIANFLSNVDNIIEEQEGKVKDLEQYKKGMMQKIFKQEIRFKDDNGLDYPAWEEKKLGEITDIGTGSNDLQDKDNNGLYPFFVRSKNIERINQYTFDGEAILIPGDGNIGQIYHYINGKFAYHQRVYKISDFKKGVLGKYIYFYMSKFFLKEALKNSVKATVDSLRLPTLTRMLIKLPCLEEQRKIANFLSNIDNIVEEEKNKLEDLKLWKKGLLQQMFV